ncbi:hypothetical protein ACFLYG_03025 [Chloroflexota bacterium]
MEATQPIIAEFSDLHDRFRKAFKRIDVLQSTAIEGMRKVGIGCITEESRAEFAALEKEINLFLARMREICEALH